MARSPAFKQIIRKGTAKDDILVSGEGAYRLVGSSGNDRLVADWDDIANTPTGVLIYDGGPGTDTLDFSQLDRAIGIDLYFGPYIYRSFDRTLFGEFEVFYNPDPGDRLSGAVSGIENVIGTDFSDYLVGSSGNNAINGRDGDDYISSQRGTDVVVGGDGDDLIILGSHSSTVTGDDDQDMNAIGNDIFQTIGNDAGVYSVHRITDFDLRESESDLQYDRLFYHDYQTITWSQNAAGELVANRWVQGEKIGEIVFSGLGADDLDMVEVWAVDYSSSTPVATQVFPEWG